MRALGKAGGIEEDGGSCEGCKTPGGGDGGLREAWGGGERRGRTWGHDGGREGTQCGDGGVMRAAKRLVEAMRADDEGPPMTSSTIGAVEHMRAA